jgi:hypothetical protein
MSDVDFLGKFRCNDLTPVQYDGLLAFSFNRADIETARSLMSTKWWDYRFIHPGQAFFLYAHHYALNIEKWRSMFGVSDFAAKKLTDHPIWRTEKIATVKRSRLLRDLRQARSEPTTHLVLSAPIHRTSLWRGMCFADQYGVPYEKWISWAFELAFECKWTRLPSPSALYTDAVVKHVTEKWRVEQENLMALPKDPRYLAENFESDPTQIAFQKWLLNLIAQRPNPVIALVNFLDNEPLIDIDIADSILGGGVLQDALRRCR